MKTSQAFHPAPAVSSPRWKSVLFSDTSVLVGVAALFFLFHLLTNGQYGFHRDELAFLDDGRALDWGFVSYPPLAPLLARLEWELFGASLIGFRLLPALAMSAAMVLTGLMARDLGGRRWAQLVAAIAVAIAPAVMIYASFFSYAGFDFFWWTLIAWLVVRLIRSDDPRWWLGIGLAIGLGMQTKYTLVFLVAGIVAGVLFTPMRRQLGSRWLWLGVACSLLLFLPNLIWQVRHAFISLDFLSSIHARDIQWGRTTNYLPGQFFVSTSPAAVLLWVPGLWWVWANPAGKRYRLLGWMYVVPFVLFWVSQGREYYLAGAYPMLIAAGAVYWETLLAKVQPLGRAVAKGVLYTGLVVFGVIAAALTLPLAPINSTWWDVSSAVNENLREEIGWPELVKAVAAARDKLPAEQRAGLGVLAGNYGEAGAINLYGPTYGLPRAISITNSGWLRGYGDPAPETVIVVGFTSSGVSSLFKQCRLGGEVSNPNNVRNEETEWHRTIYVCSEPRQPWAELWPKLRNFG